MVDAADQEHDRSVRTVGGVMRARFSVVAVLKAPSGAILPKPIKHSSCSGLYGFSGLCNCSGLYGLAGCVVVVGSMWSAAD